MLNLKDFPTPNLVHYSAVLLQKLMLYSLIDLFTSLIPTMFLYKPNIITGTGDVI